MVQAATGLPIHRLQSLGRAAVGGHFDRQVGKPAVRCRAVPVLDIRRDVDHIPRAEFPGGFAPGPVVPPPPGDQ